MCVVTGGYQFYESRIRRTRSADLVQRTARATDRCGRWREKAATSQIVHRVCATRSLRQTPASAHTTVSTRIQRQSPTHSTTRPRDATLTSMLPLSSLANIWSANQRRNLLIFSSLLKNRWTFRHGCRAVKTNVAKPSTDPQWGKTFIYTDILPDEVRTATPKAWLFDWLSSSLRVSMTKSITVSADGARLYQIQLSSKWFWEWFNYYL